MGEISYETLCEAKKALSKKVIPLDNRYVYTAGRWFCIDIHGNVKEINVEDIYKA